MQPPVRIPERKWWICLLLFLATAIVYLDRQVLALTADRIIVDFGISKVGFGRIIAAFRYSYGFVQIIGGFLVDEYGPRIIFPLASGVWSIAGLLTGLATTVGMLTGCRFLLGVGEAFNWPCALKVCHQLFPPKDRPLVNGIFNSGGAVGALIGPVIVTLITIYFSWRAAFVATAGIGMLWIFAWLVLTRDVSAQLAGSPCPPGNVFRVTIRILSLPGFWMLAVCSLIINSVNYYLVDWVPLYLETTRGFSFSRGNFLSIVVYGGSFAGSVMVGFLVRWIVTLGYGITSAKRSALFISCVLMLSSIAAGLTSFRYLAVICLALTGIGVAGFLVIYLTLIQDLEPAHVGLTSGMLGGLSNIVYGYVSPYVGRLADHQNNSLVLIIAGLLPWLAFLAISPKMGAKQQ